jgi:hypothetical protein
MKVIGQLLMKNDLCLGRAFKFLISAIRWIGNAFS